MSPRSQNLVHYVTDWLIPVVLILWIPLVAALYVADHNAKANQYRASVASCVRGNALRQRLNDRDDRYRAVFAEAADVLKRVGTTPAADKLAEVMAQAAQPASPLPLVDCASAYTEPKWFWQ